MLFYILLIICIFAKIKFIGNEKIIYIISINGIYVFH